MASKLDKTKSTNSKLQSLLKPERENKLEQFQHKLQQLLKPLPKTSTSRDLPLITSRWSLNTPTVQEPKPSACLEKLEMIQ